MKKFSLNKIASDGNYYAIQEILVKQEWTEELRRQYNEHFTTVTFPLAFEFVQETKEEIARKKLEPNSARAETANLVNDICIADGKVISRLCKGMRTIFVSTAKCDDESKASFVVRSGPKKDALVCPWCIVRKRENYRECFQPGPFWLFHTIFTAIETQKGTRFLYVHRCRHDNKLFIVERPDSRLKETEFYGRCPYCEAGKDKFLELMAVKENIMYLCTTCKSVFSVGGHPKDNVWELSQSEQLRGRINSEWLETVPYDFRSLDGDYY